MSNRRGFTLIELLVALIMLVIVAGGVYQLLIAVQRVTRKQTEVSNLQGNLRNGMQLVQNELQEISTAATLASDISAITASSITYRAMRGVGETCGVTTSVVKIRQANYAGRDPVATGRDSLLIYQDNDTTKTSDDVWLPRAITGISTGTCTTGLATPSWDLTVDLTGQVTSKIFTPSPVRTIEFMQLGRVTDGGKDWLGIRSNSGGEATLIPVIGPLTANGVAFTYHGFENGTTTATLTAIKVIKLVLRGVSAQRVNTGMGSAMGNPTDSLLVHVQLRNSR